MIAGHELSTRDVDRAGLTDRQQVVLTLVTQYYAVAREVPSSGWVSRRLHISRQRAHAHMEAIRDKLTRTR